MNQVDMIGKIIGPINNFQQSNGEQVSKFKLSVEASKQKDVTIDCVAWRNIAELIKYEVRSSDLVSITGKFNPREVIVSGTSAIMFEVLVERINLIMPEHDITKFEQES